MNLEFYKHELVIAIYENLGFHSSDDLCCIILGYDTGRWVQTFWRNILPPYPGYPPTKLHDIITQDTMGTVMLECTANTVKRYYNLIFRNCFENTSWIHR